MSLQTVQWALGALAALMIGISKTGVPGIGILVVPLLAAIFGGRTSIGIMLPMLIFGDCFAVAWYRRHAQWDKLTKVMPWVAVGMAVGGLALWYVGLIKANKDILGIFIGVMTLVLLFLHLAQGRLGERLTPNSRVGVASTGVAAGFATTVSNAAGSIMTIYMTAQKLPKQQFMGTIAWYFLIFNVVKLPIYVALTIMNPQQPVITPRSFLFTAFMAPAILVGVFIGRWLLPRIPQKAFESVVLVLAAAAAIKLLVS